MPVAPGAPPEWKAALQKGCKERSWKRCSKLASRVQHQASFRLTFLVGRWGELSSQSQMQQGEDLLPNEDQCCLMQPKAAPLQLNLNWFSIDLGWISNHSQWNSDALARHFQWIVTWFWMDFNAFSMEYGWIFNAFAEDSQLLSDGLQCIFNGVG